jgi:hypothetical protein
MEIGYRAFNRNTDLNKQRKLFSLSFPETAGQSAGEISHYQWKFESFPYKNPSYEYVASEPEELVGYYAALPYHYQINRKEVVCGMVCDVMTHPDRRGKGIFTKIGHYSTNEMKKENLAFTTGYPIRPEVIPGHIKVGWKIVLEMPMYLRLVGVGSLIPKNIKFLAPIINPLVRLLQCWTHFKKAGYEVSTLSRESFLKLEPTLYNNFLHTWLNEQENSLIKSLDFLSWRTNAPHSTYYFLTLKKDQKIVGLSIARPMVLKGVESLAILDFMMLTDHLHASGVLHQYLWKLALGNKKDVIVSMTIPRLAKKYRFFHFLYVKTPAVFSLIIKKLSDNIADEDLFNQNKWHLFWIDSDDA